MDFNPAVSGWALAGFVFHIGGGAACLLAMWWLFHRGDPGRPDRNAAIAALGLTAFWCAAVAAYGHRDPAVGFAEAARNLGWIFVLYRLFANDGRHRSLTPIRPVIAALAFVECLQPALLLTELRIAITPELDAMVFRVSALFRVLVAVGALVLLHNLYVGASATTRHMLRWSAAALAGMWAFDLNFYTIAYLGETPTAELAAFRGLVAGLMAVPLAIGGIAAAEEMRLRPSRDVAFQTLSLLVIGVYLIMMVGVAQSLSVLGGDIGRLTQVGFVLAASVVALLWLPSQRLRGWLRVTAVKHLFQHRYDYRAEWLRFTRTIGDREALENGTSQTLHQRVIKSVADITESLSGMLMLPGRTGAITPAAYWNWQGGEPESDALPHDLLLILEAEKFILDLDDVRAGKDRFGEAALVPEWMLAETHAWALVPLLHFDRILGVVLVTRPAAPRALDWEDFDLLRIAGQQLASYLAEESGQKALGEAARFDEFNRRIAFVVHDIKNLASQLALLAGNAERHAEKPEFRADMLVTLRNSADKLNALLSRLVRYNANPAEKREPADLIAIARRVVARFDGVQPVTVTRAEPCIVMADADALEQSLLHLVQNAADASGQDEPVYVEVVRKGLQGVVRVVDCGEGMAPEFMRDELFRPFVSTKNGGFGIGAYEARELVTAMGGRVDVDSRPGLGTRFSVSLPLSATELVPQATPRSEKEAA